MGSISLGQHAESLQQKSALLHRGRNGRSADIEVEDSRDKKKQSLAGEIEVEIQVHRKEYYVQETWLVVNFRHKKTALFDGFFVLVRLSRPVQLYFIFTSSKHSLVVK